GARGRPGPSDRSVNGGKPRVAMGYCPYYVPPYRWADLWLTFRTGIDRVRTHLHFRGRTQSRHRRWAVASAGILPDPSAPESKMPAGGSTGARDERARSLAGNFRLLPA